MEISNVEAMVRISTAASKAEAAKIFLSTVRELGFENFTYGLAVSNASQRVAKLMRMSSARDDWSEYYERAQLYKSDILVDYCTTHTAPIFRSDIEDAIKLGRLSEEDCVTFNRAKEFGFVEGITIPLQVSGPGYSGISLLADPQMSAEECKQIFSARKPEIMDIVDALHIGLNYSFLGMEHFSLTKREAEVLKWYAEGRREHEVAERMGNSPHTVQNQLKSAIERLGAVNKSHAIAIAVMLKLI